LADYAREYEKIRAAAADLIAISVDRIDQASGMKRDLNLPFHVLCDTERKAITAWGLVNHREGNIAFPASFIIDRELRLRWRVAETLASRADPSASSRRSLISPRTARSPAKFAGIPSGRARCSCGRR
jgi:peroxiredoxin